MLKKITAIILSMIMVMSASGVFAATLTPDYTSGTSTYTDNFEQHEITADTALTNGYPGSYTSDVFVGYGNTKATILYNTGKDNSKAVKFTQYANSNLGIATNTITPQGAAVLGDYTETLELSFDMKASYPSEPPATGTEETVRISIGCTNIYGNNPLFALERYTDEDGTVGGRFKDVTGTDTAGTTIEGSEYDCDKWYKVVIRQVYTGHRYGYIIDENGTVIAKATRELPWANNAISPIFMKAYSKAEANVIIDNAVLRYYHGERIAPQLVSSSVSDDAKEVSVNTNSISVSFDQPISSAASYRKATITPEGGEAVTCTVTTDSTKLYTYTISWGNALVGSTKYTLDLSGLKNDGGAAVGGANTITFMTEEAEIAPDVYSSAPENGADNISGDVGEMTVTFNKAMTAPASVTLTGGSKDVTATVTKADEDGKIYKIAWTDILDGLKTYSVSLTDFKDANDAVPVTTALAFTTASKELAAVKDSFEDSTKLESDSSYVSPLLTINKNTAPPKLALIDGYTSGTKALQVTANGNVGLMRTTERYTLSENEKLVATWRIRIDNIAFSDGASDNIKNSTMMWVGGVNSGDYAATYQNAATAIRTKSDGTLYINNPYEAAANNATLYEDRWYNVTLVASGKEMNFYFVDDTTKEVIYTRSAANANLANGAYIKPFAAGKSSTTDSGTGVTTKTNDGLVFTVDDFTVYKVNSAFEEHDLALTVQSSEEIDDRAASYTFSANQPIILSESMLQLYADCAQGSAGALLNERIYKHPLIKYIDFCNYEVSYQELSEYTDYTIDYSGLKAASGADLGVDKPTSLVEFRTLPAPEEISVVGDITGTGLNQGDVINAAMYSKGAHTTTVIAAFYKRNFPARLSDIHVTENVSFTEGMNDINIELKKNIDADSVRLYTWDSISELKPLMKEYKALTPHDTLDVLLIGSSLSEDTGRLFDGVLKASGHDTESDSRDINITVKFVGGGGFTYHYNNLKREIESGLEEAYKNSDAATIEAYVEEQRGIMNGTVDSEESDTSRRLYTTFKNGVTQEDSPDDYIMLSALLEKEYDFISIQPSAHAYPYNEAMAGTADEVFEDYEDELSYLTSKIREYQPKAEIVLFQTWTHCYGDKARRHKLFTNAIKPYVDTWAENTGRNVGNITLDGEKLTIIPAGYAFYLADEFTDWAGKQFNLTSGDNSAEAKREDELAMKFNTSEGLFRDTDHASYYGSFLSDAVFYEMLTGLKASAGTVSSPAMPVPTGKGPELDASGAVIENTTKTYFTVSPEEHLAKLEELSDIAHQAVSEYNTLRRIKKVN